MTPHSGPAARLGRPDHEDRPVDAVAEAYVDAFAELDPTMATTAGLPCDESRLTDLSPDGFGERSRALRDTYAAATAAVPSDERERAAQDAFLERLRLSVELDDARVPQSQVSVIDSRLHDLRAVFDLMPTASEEDWTHIDGRLAGVPAALAGLRSTLLQAAAEGHVAPARQLRAVATQVRSWTGRTGTAESVFTSLAKGAPEGPLARRLIRHAEEGTAAMAAFGDFLGEQLAPRGAPKEAVGRDVYSLHSRSFLGAEVDLDETYRWGFEELHRIEQEMATEAGRVVAGGTVDDAVAALDADPLRRIDTKEAFRGWMQGLADETVRDLADTHFDIPQQMRRIECRIAPTTDGGIYYTPPSEDFSRPGRMWWSVPEQTTSFSTWREVTTVYHEGVPGHHLQIGQTIMRRELLNRWQRQLCWVSGSGEGWALYAERLMDELGYLDDPGNRLGMLDSQAFRAARVVVDIGMHLELEIPRENAFGFHPGERWTPELGYEFMRAHCRIDDAQLRFEVDRYLGWPGQAPSYKVGERLWLEARDAVRRRRGAAFDLRQFHADALNLGSIGLDPLTTALARL